MVFPSIGKGLLQPRLGELFSQSLKDLIFPSCFALEGFLGREDTRDPQHGIQIASKKAVG